MAFNNTNVFLFLACILAGYALYRVAPLLAGLFSLPFLQIIGLLAIIIFAFVIIYIGVRVLVNGGWRC